MRRMALWAGLMAAAGPGEAGREAAASPALASGRPGVSATDGAVPEAVQVTTHSREYCDQLAAQVVALRGQAGGTQPEVRLLLEEGERMCAQGQIRPGIARLRRAIVLLRGPGPRESGQP